MIHRRCLYTYDVFRNGATSTRGFSMPDLICNLLRSSVTILLNFSTARLTRSRSQDNTPRFACPHHIMISPNHPIYRKKKLATHSRRFRNLVRRLKIAVPTDTAGSGSQSMVTIIAELPSLYNSPLDVIVVARKGSFNSSAPSTRERRTRRLTLCLSSFAGLWLAKKNAGSET